MKSPTEYLNLAKEKVANAANFSSWSALQYNVYRDPKGSTRFMEDCLNQAVIAAISLQQEDAEKDKRQATIWYDNLMSEKNELFADYQSVIEQLKAEIDHWKLENNSLQSTLSQEKATSANHLNALGVALKQIDELKESIKGEKAKAFDEGCEAQITFWSLPKNVRPENPYKQDAQPKDK